MRARLGEFQKGEGRVSDYTASEENYVLDLTIVPVTPLAAGEASTIGRATCSLGTQSLSGRIDPFMDGACFRARRIGSGIYLRKFLLFLAAQDGANGTGRVKISACIVSRLTRPFRPWRVAPRQCMLIS